MRCLITGIAGFAGRHLAELLLARGDEVHGMLRAPEGATRLAHLSARWPRLVERLAAADVTDGDAVAAAVADIKPEVVFHLAGVSFAPDAARDPAAAMRVNAIGAINVFAAVARSAPHCRVVAVGSADAYGAVAPEDLPVREDCPFRPVTQYGASKAALDLLAYEWAHGAGLDIVRLRPFNHTGPGQRPDFVCPNFARQLVAVAQGRLPPVLSVGDLDVARDFSDVRDVVAAYVAACERGAGGEAYNICSGIGRTVHSVLDALAAIVGVEVRVEVAAERLRPRVVPAMIGSAAKLTAATGWAPRYAWEETLRAVVEDWRQ